MKRKFVYFFAKGMTEGNKDMKGLLGGKGANLAEMAGIGLPVPPGFTITTEVCNLFAKSGRKVPSEAEKEIQAGLKKLERVAGQKFGQADNPLLVSVRSGAKFSMPGMMDTILNLGLNDRTVEGLARKSRNRRFALDCYRRLIHMFGDVVLEVPKKKFEEILRAKKEAKHVEADFQMPESLLEELIAAYKKLIKAETGKDFPQDVHAQLKLAIAAVFRSWDNPRAITYRRLNHIPDDLGTAVNIQLMVFGNIGDNSATGVGFTRSPATGEKAPYGEYLTNAQGEDVVAGIRTPSPISDLAREMPRIYDELLKVMARLERHYRDVQDFEFTIQEGKLYMLQTRNGKRTGPAAVKIAVDMVREKLITKREALTKVEPLALNQLLHPIFDGLEKAKHEVLAKGLAASPGAASGQVVFTAEDAVTWKHEGKRVILVRDETSPDDIHGMSAAQGILTATGGMTSHAAVVGRQMGKPAVVGCGTLRINEEGKSLAVKGRTLREGDYVSIEGSTGEVLEGQIPTKASEILQCVRGQLAPGASQVYTDFCDLLSWADGVRRLGVRANSDTPQDAQVAFAFGAEGIGLARTEHMFFGEHRLPIIKELKAKGSPDPSKVRELETLLERVKQLSEFNPMLGHRGCRLGITYPEITEMQATAIFEAACQLAQEGKKVLPEIMIPLTGTREELADQKVLLDRAAKEQMARFGVKVDYLIGTMIEIPRGALVADEIAREAEFFSFGTNDLTQTTYGLSRDDSGKFINEYLKKNIWKFDPFETLDYEGVGQLMQIAVTKGRSTRPKLKVGICGVHGGDPRSIMFCHKIGLNYVSCSAYQIPIARLAAAQAVLQEAPQAKPASRGKKKTARKPARKPPRRTARAKSRR
jgi:pyruvate,orthophosphate dikinase